MKHEIKIIGENYPNVGDVIYWKDEDGDMHDDVVLRVEKIPGVETVYFISVTKNGGGSFITESDIINPLSADIQIYKKKKLKEKIDKVWSDNDFREEMFNRLKKTYGEDQAYKMIDILSET